MEIVFGPSISERPMQPALLAPLRLLYGHPLSSMACARYSEVEQSWQMANRHRLSRIV